MSSYESRKRPIIKFVKGDKEKALEASGIHLDESTRCSVCNDRITIDNIGAVISHKGGNIFVCSKPQCMIARNILSPGDKGE